MIQYYRVPKQQGRSLPDQVLCISEQFQLKDSIYNKSIYKIKILNLKNSNIKDKTLLLLKQLSEPLQIIELNLAQNFSFITDETVQIITELNLPNLQALNLADNQITDHSLIIIAKSRNCSRLEKLIVYGNAEVSSQGLVVLAVSIDVKRLKVLDLHATAVDNAGVGYFLRSENSACLESLNLSMNWKQITDRTLYEFGTSKYCKKLQRLNLQDCNVTDIGINELCQSQNCSNLRELILNNTPKQINNIITDKSLSTISFSKYLINLQCLELRNTQITSKGLTTLSVSLACEKLSLLRLSYCQKLTNQSCHPLQKIISYQSLTKLYINSTNITEEQFEALQSKNPQVNIIF